jgi:hypothetical protein
MAEVALRETIDADLGTLFEFQADPEASAMAAFPSRDLPAFLERGEGTSRLSRRFDADPAHGRADVRAGVTARFRQALPRDCSESQSMETLCGKVGEVSS